RSWRSGNASQARTGNAPLAGDRLMTLPAQNGERIMSKANETSAHPRTNPPSANGYRLEYVDADGETRNIVASWPAPFFVLCTDCEPPLLYHAETRADA